MSLLFDQNISFKVSKALQDLFPGCRHLSDEGISSYSDLAIWEYAKNKDFCLVTFDSDFIDLSALRGFPPKVIWLRNGNTSSALVIKTLSDHVRQIADFINNDEDCFLEIVIK